MRENWSWSFDILGGSEENSFKFGTVSYFIEAEEQVLGRETYKVGIYANSQKSADIWVDKEKLILVKEETEEFVITLLNSTSQQQAE